MTAALAKFNTAQKNIDINRRCGLSSAHLLNTGSRAATAVVNNAAFLYPAHGKSAGLSREYIEYLELPSIAVFNSPALADSFEQENRAMCKTPYFRLAEQEVICEQIDGAISKLTFVRCSMLRGRTVAKLHHKELQEVLLQAEYLCFQARRDLIKEVVL